MKLGILDFGFTLDGTKESISKLIASVNQIEKLGFSRYWPLVLF